MAAQGTFGTDFDDRSTRTIVGTMLSTEYRTVIKIGPKGALGSHEPNSLRSKPRTECQQERNLKNIMVAFMKPLLQRYFYLLVL